MEETKKRSPLLPANYVSLQELQQRKIKQKQQEEERLRKLEEEEPERQRRKQQVEEEEELEKKFMKSREALESTKPYFHLRDRPKRLIAEPCLDREAEEENRAIDEGNDRKPRRNEITVKSLNPEEEEKKVEAFGRREGKHYSRWNRKYRIPNLEAQGKEEDGDGKPDLPNREETKKKKKKKKRIKNKKVYSKDEAVEKKAMENSEETLESKPENESENVAPESSPGKPAVEKRENRRSFLPNGEYRPVRYSGGESEADRTAEIAQGKGESDGKGHPPSQKESKKKKKEKVYKKRGKAYKKLESNGESRPVRVSEREADRTVKIARQLGDLRVVEEVERKRSMTGMRGRGFSRFGSFREFGFGGRSDLASDRGLVWVRKTTSS